MDNVEGDDNDNNLECFQNDPLHLHLHPIQKEAADNKKEEGQKVEALQGKVNGKLYTALAPVVQTVDRAIHQAPVVQKLDSNFHQINHYPPDKYQGNQYCVIKQIEIYLVDSALHLLSNCGRINPYPVDKYQGNKLQYSLDRGPFIQWKVLSPFRTTAC